jgi:type IV pilus assembly protein PilC
MKEFRFRGIGANGDSVRGTVYASGKSRAEEKVDELADEHQFSVDEVLARPTYHYKVRHPSGETATGAQRAFSAQELEEALERMDLEVLSVRKKWFSFSSKPPASDIVLFVRQAANLLRENLPFDQILSLLIPDIENPRLKQAVQDLLRDLKNGVEAKKAFMKHQHVFGRFTAYMLGIASRSGNMAEIFDATATFLERRDDFKKNVRSAMITPAVTMVATVAAFLWYVWYIIPKTVGLFGQFDIDLPPMTAASMSFAGWMDQNYLYVAGAIVAMVGAVWLFARSTKGRFLIHKYMISLPVIGSLIHKMQIEIFCRVFSVLYSGSGNNIEVIRIASEATGNTYLAHRIKTVTIPRMVAQGMGLIPAMQASDVFTSMAIRRFRSGAETGNVKESARQMADYYAKETDLKLEMTLQGIQTFVSLFITTAIMALTVLTAEMAKIQPSASDMMGM